MFKWAYNTGTEILLRLACAAASGVARASLLPPRASTLAKIVDAKLAPKSIRFGFRDVERAGFTFRERKLQGRDVWQQLGMVATCELGPRKLLAPGILAYDSALGAIRSRCLFSVWCGFPEPSDVAASVSRWRTKVWWFEQCVLRF